MIEIFVDLTSEASFTALDAVDELLVSDSAAYTVQLRNLPLSRSARTTHGWLMGAAAQGKMWPYLQFLASDPSVARMAEAAQAVGVDLDRLRHDVESGMFDAQIDEDSARATELAVRGSPAVAFGETRLDGVPSPANLGTSMAQALQ